MSLTLTVDGDRWRAHLRSVADANPGLVPVIKGNGYGFTRGRLARKAQWLGVDTIAVGTYDELEHVASRFDGSLLVLTPWRPFGAALTLEDRTASRVVHTVYAGRVTVRDWPGATTQPGDALREILTLMGCQVELVAVIGSNDPELGEPDKTSVVMAVLDEPGSLLGALRPFADRGRPWPVRGRGRCESLDPGRPRRRGLWLRDDVPAPAERHRVTGRRYDPGSPRIDRGIRPGGG